MSAIATAHRSGLGGTAAAAIMGRSRFKTRHTVYAECMGIRPESKPSLPMEIGNHFEPFVRKWYERETGQRGYVPETLRHHKYDWLIGHLDWLRDDKKRVADFKVAGLHTAHEWIDPEKQQIPQEYYFQGLHYGTLTGIREWDFVVLIGTEIRIYTMRYNESLARLLFNAELFFWNEHVLKKVPPPIDHTKSCTNLMGWLHPRNESELRFAETQEELALCRRFAEVKQNFEAEELNLEELKNKLKGSIGDAEGLRWDGGAVTWKCDKRGRRTFRSNIRENGE